MAAKKATGESNIIVAVDILPMRAIPNVITLIGDITTEKCKAQIKAKLQTALADVVLCDGAPNVGASYDRDAYQQNEIALHALKCATQHLRRRGTFVTKIYRSSDYSSYLWIAKQLFENVQAVKPTASRSQSAEIFLVCTGYLDPTSIDPRMLDPKSVFEQVDGAATGGGDTAQSIGTKGITIFHKKFDEKRRQRQGYDMSTMDATMRNIGFIKDFVESSGSGALVSKEEKKDPIQMLSFCTGLAFHCHLCKGKEERKKMNLDYSDIPDCNCQFYLNHKATTPEIKACVSDLKVLNKGDFKGLLAWREKMRDAVKALQATSDDDEDDTASKISIEKDLDSDAEEEKIQSEIARLRHKKLREQKKIKKKEREIASKRRKRAALGMDLNAIEVPEAEKMFSLATITSKGKLEVAREVDLNKISDEKLFPTIDSDEDHDDENVERNEYGEVVAQGEEDDVDESTGYSYRLDRELDSAYDRYLTETKKAGAKAGTKMAKRSKKAMRLKAAEQATEDDEMMNDDTRAYAKMLQGQKDSDDESSGKEDGASSSDDDDGFRSAPVTPEEHQRSVKTKKKLGTSVDKNPLLHTLPDDPASIKSARWFSNPLFESIGTTASLATMAGPKATSASKDNLDDLGSEDENNDAVEQLSSDDETPTRKKSRKKGKPEEDENNQTSKGLNADEVLAMMPKTDKQIRHEKRLKAMERMERKKARRARLAGEPEGGFEVVDKEEEATNNENEKDKLANLSEKERKRLMDARALIKAGLGSHNKNDEDAGFEIISKADSRNKGGLLPIMDNRKYDSENEDYDSDDYARTLALGTMMLRKSKEKALVDASYNRFAWNDPEGLPDWFVDDENKNYRPQLPIPPELLAKMKEKFMSLATRPIAKVAEARARKNKRAKLQLSAAKKKAEAVANSSEMSEAMKLKAISKAMRGHDASKPGKTYVVSQKGGKTRGGKGVKLVDKRMISDKRSMERASSKRKNGKKGGLTGSKRRRNHS
jgi:AdoMet-dependent rRNA methyltransferase SPB1